MKTLLILNPNAGNGDDAVEQARGMAGASRVEVRETRETGHARELACDAVRAGVERVIAGGGDGTLSEVVNGMNDAGLSLSSLGVLPMGTANDFAHALDLPLKLPAAWRIASGPAEREMDVMLARGVDDPDDDPRCLINAATGGFSRVANDKLTEPIKKRWGPLAYLRAAVAAIPEMPEYVLTLDVDGERLSTPCCNVVVANGRRAGGMPLIPTAQPDDRELDLMVITACGLLDKIALTGEYLMGDHLESDGVLYRKARRVRIESDPPLEFSSDGEPVGQTPMTFEIHGERLRVAVG